MKLFKSIQKSLKILARSKSSAVVVLIAPLLIVLVIGLGFLDSGDSSLNIGVVVESENDLTNRFVSSLNSDTNNIISFTDIDTCVSSIEEAQVLSCVYFPEDFSIEGNSTAQIDFYVDESRVNLVYRLINSISSNVQGQTTEISEEITQRMLEVLSSSTSVVQSNVEFGEELNSSLTELKKGMEDDVDSLSSVETDSSTVTVSSPSSLADDVSSAYRSLLSRAKTVESSGRSVLDAVDENSTTGYGALESALDSLKSKINEEDSVEEDIDALDVGLGEISSGVSELRAMINDVADAGDKVASNMGTRVTNIDALQEDVDSFTANQRLLVSNLLSVQSRGAGDITAPVSTNIKTVSPDFNLLTFSFPYLLVLVVMLVGIMLASTLVFMEKDSKAFFRNFTTPTSGAFFTLINFLTATIVISLQVSVILLGAYYFLEIPILNNIEVTLAVLFMGMTMFIFIGMLVGELFNTSEAITMASIGIGSVLMFMSNLVLPIETLGETIREISMYNPFVMVGEAVRASLLFEMPFLALIGEMFMLLGYSIGLLIVIMLVRKIKAIKYTYGLKKNAVVLQKEGLKVKDQTVLDVEQLISALKGCSDEDYRQLTSPENLIADWLEKSKGEKYLAIRVKNKSRDKAIEVLEESLKKKN